MKLRICAVALALATLMISMTGCAVLVVGGAAAAGAGTYIYVTGELKVAEATTVDKAWAAALAAMKDLNFSITSQKKDALQGVLVARTATDTKITIKVRKESET